MKILSFLFALFICSAYPLSAESMSASLLPSTESDPDAFIHNCNAINGDYCESA
ncbi:MAG: hypothetical protein K940chlam9_01222, partial [Chlamydiae bacterium]|nr:hypothetical protein [Chlamydiota bacterium]